MQKILIAILSHNRGRYLENLLESIQTNFSGHSTRIYDDYSDDLETIEILEYLKKTYPILRHNQHRTPHKNHLGGLWENMSLALQDAVDGGFERIFYVQDDCQFVRPVTAEFLAACESIFERKKNIVQIHTNFFKGFSPDLEDRYRIDHELGTYLDPSYGICDLGLTHVSRLSESGFTFSKSEGYNNKIAKEKYGFQLAIARDPVMMYTPWPETHRDKTSILTKFFREVNHRGVHAGVNPYECMTHKEIAELLERPIEELPIAERFLRTRKDLKKPWWYSNVFETKKIKRLDLFLQGSWIWDGPQEYKRLCSELEKKFPRRPYFRKLL